MDKISIADRCQVEHIRAKYHHELSSHAFANLFLWQKQLQLSLEVHEDSFFVKEESENSHTYFYPCGSIDAQMGFIDSHLRDDEFEMVYLRDQDKDFLAQQYRDAFCFEKIDESSEYIFERASLAALSGKKTANVRNQMNRLHREHRMAMLPFREEDEASVWDFIKNTEAHEHIPGYQGLLDDNMILDVMRYRKELGFYVVTVWADEQLRGVTFGFPLTEDTMDGCMEKHDSSIPGLAYYTQMALILQAPQQYKFMNAEEDLGLQGLQTMKRHMNPCKMNTVWRAKRTRQNGDRDHEKAKGRYFFGQNVLKALGAIHVYGNRPHLR